MTHYLFVAGFTLVGALLGWATNCIAIWMLFHPRRRVRLGPWRLQGLIPRRQDEIAETVARAIVRHLLDEDEMHKILRRIDLSRHLLPIVNEVIERELSTSLASRFKPAASIQKRVIAVVQQRVASRLPHTLNDLHEGVAAGLIREVDVESHLRERLGALDLDQLEELTWSVGRRELRTIEYLGGLIGALIGLAQGLLYLFLKDKL